jgi:hypothetical protein
MSGAFRSLDPDCDAELRGREHIDGYSGLVGQVRVSGCWQRRLPRIENS